MKYVHDQLHFDVFLMRFCIFWLIGDVLHMDADRLHGRWRHTLLMFVCNLIFYIFTDTYEKWHNTYFPFFLSFMRHLPRKKNQKNICAWHSSALSSQHNKIMITHTPLPGSIIYFIYVHTVVATMMATR